jgi:site-specific DNA-adenine methylase
MENYRRQKLLSFFSYFGAKQGPTVKLYPAPEHETIIEPFAGSAGYSLLYADRKVILSDIDPIIVGVWDYLINATEEDILKLPDIGDDRTVDDLGVHQEAKWLIGFWISAGSTSARKSPSAWMRQGRRPDCFWGHEKRCRIASQLRYIRHWKVFQCNYEYYPPFDDCTWFVDPPYQVAGTSYRFGSKALDYGKLGSWCRSLGGQVIVCENDGATWLPFAPLYDKKARAIGSRTREAVWLNSFVDL